MNEPHDVSKKLIRLFENRTCMRESLDNPKNYFGILQIEPTCANLRSSLKILFIHNIFI